MWRGRGNRSKGDNDDDDIELALFDTTALLAEKAAPCIFECLEISVDRSFQTSEFKKALFAIFYCICLVKKKKEMEMMRQGKGKKTLNSLLSHSPSFF